MGHQFAIAASHSEKWEIRIGAMAVCSWELLMHNSTTITGMSGKLSEAMCTTCDPRPEPEIWEALKQKSIEVVSVAPTVVPGPILRMLSKHCLDGGKLRFYKLVIRNKPWPEGIGSTRWMALPEDTTKHLSAYSNPRWEERRRSKWIDIQGMTPEQLEAAIRGIILDELTRFKNTGRAGLDLVLEVFNWTALEYEEALRLTAKVLYGMFVQEEVNLCDRDHWKIATKEA
jgi:hypothetical protein